MRIYKFLYLPFTDVFVHLPNSFIHSRFRDLLPKELVPTGPCYLNPYPLFLNL